MAGASRPRNILNNEDIYIVRSYDVAVTALAIDAPLRWTDNALSLHDVPHVDSTHRGVARRVHYPALLHLAAARELHAELGLSVAEALRAAGELLAPGTDGVIRRRHLRVALDLAELERSVQQRLREALESAPVTRRGRPPQRRGRPAGSP